MRGSRRGRRLRRIGQGAAVALLLPIGIAHLAVNTVPVTYAGETEQPVVLPAVLSATHKAKVNLAHAQNGQDEYQFLNLGATLEYDGEPVDGVTVVFSVGGHSVCTDVTKHGNASCNSSMDTTLPVSLLGSTPPSEFVVSLAPGGPYQAAPVTQAFWKNVGP